MLLLLLLPLPGAPCGMFTSVWMANAQFFIINKQQQQQQKQQL